MIHAPGVIEGVALVFPSSTCASRPNREVRRDDSCADHRPRFMPGLPAHRESVPSFGALLRKHLVNEVADMDHASDFVEGEGFIFNQFDDVGALGHRHRRCGLVQRFGIDGKVRRGPGVYSRARGRACRRACGRTCRRLCLRCGGNGGRYVHEQETRQRRTHRRMGHRTPGSMECEHNGKPSRADAQADGAVRSAGPTQ